MMEQILLRMLFQMLQKYTGIKFSHATQQLFIDDPTQFEQESPFSLYDVEITPCIKTIQYAGKVITGCLAKAANTHLTRAAMARQLPDLLHQSFSPAINNRMQHAATQVVTEPARISPSFRAACNEVDLSFLQGPRVRRLECLILSLSAPTPSGPQSRGTQPSCLWECIITLAYQNARQRLRKRKGLHLLRDPPSICSTSSCSWHFITS